MGSRTEAAARAAVAKRTSEDEKWKVDIFLLFSFVSSMEIFWDKSTNFF